MSYYDILQAPVISEKAYAGMERGAYSFWVSPKATKTEIKDAIQKMMDATAKAEKNYGVLIEASGAIPLASSFSPSGP